MRVCVCPPAIAAVKAARILAPFPRNHGCVDSAAVTLLCRHDGLGTRYCRSDQLFSLLCCSSLEMNRVSGTPLRCRKKHALRSTGSMSLYRPILSKSVH